MTIEEQGRRICELAKQAIENSPNSKYEIGIGAIHIISELAKKDPIGTGNGWFTEVTQQLKDATV